MLGERDEATPENFERPISTPLRPESPGTKFIMTGPGGPQVIRQEFDETGSVDFGTVRKSDANLTVPQNAPIDGEVMRLETFDANATLPKNGGAKIDINDI